jgi:hypothetical protein
VDWKQVSWLEVAGLRGDAASLDLSTGAMEADWLDPLSTTAAAWLDPFTLESPGHGSRPVLRTKQASRWRTDRGAAAQPQARTDLIPLPASGDSFVTVGPTTLPAARVNRAYRATLTAKGASGTYQFTVTAGSLPSGLSLNASTGVLTGTPSGPCTLTFRITATDRESAGLTGSQKYTLIVNPARSLCFIQGTHPRWVAVVLFLALLTSVVYAFLPPSGGANIRPRLLFAVEGTGMLLFCGFLPARKKLLRMPYCGRWRILRTPVWDTGHIYLGLLSCLVIHCHAGFRTGGPLTSALMLVLWGIIGSGLCALLFRHLLVLTKAGKEGKGLMAAKIIAAGHFLSHRLHAPLTVTLFVLAAAHAVMALFY